MKKKIRDASELAKTYISPQCKVIQTSTEQFFCTSIRPGHPVDEDWEDDSDIDGGEYEFE